MEKGDLILIKSFEDATKYSAHEPTEEHKKFCEKVLTVKDVVGFKYKSNSTRWDITRDIVSVEETDLTFDSSWVACVVKEPKFKIGDYVRISKRTCSYEIENYNAGEDYSEFNYLIGKEIPLKIKNVKLHYSDKGWHMNSYWLYEFENSKFRIYEGDLIKVSLSKVKIDCKNDVFKAWERGDVVLKLFSEEDAQMFNDYLVQRGYFNNIFGKHDYPIYVKSKFVLVNSNYRLPVITMGCLYQNKFDISR